MNSENKKILEKIANTIRQLSIEAVQQANSGHPGLPMGCAEFGAYLYGVALRHNPKNSHWLNRDRFVLSAGHGSMLLYSCLHLAGFNLSLEEIKRFRQFRSQTPGHPEYGITDGVEATTGPLGQGVGNAVGQALGLKLLAAKFNSDGFPLFTGRVYCLAGDGCIMEGISSEASSLAGHLSLDNLVLIYDSNKVCLDGPLAECCSEDTAARYRAYGWEVYDVDGYDFDKIEEALTAPQNKPRLVVLHTLIGKGSPNKAGTSKVHGAALGVEEVEATKKALGLPDEPFYVSQEVRTFFAEKMKKEALLEGEWNVLFQKWEKAFPLLAQEFHQMKERKIPPDLESRLKKVEMKSPLPGRNASQQLLEVLGSFLPQLYGGSADLSCSDLTMMKSFPLISRGKFAGRNIKYGVREFAMAALATGLWETGMITPYIGTFLTFSDYMRNSIRLAALSKVQVIYQFTHDSIFLGEDGPTHQPIEHLAALRAIPQLQVIRPACSHEVRGAWIAALTYGGPTAIILSRQPLPVLPETDLPYDKGVGRGAYIVKREALSPPDFSLFATGSELSLACDVAVALEQKGKSVRVISMPCWKLFEEQPLDYRVSVVGGDLGQRVSLEAAVAFGWHKWIGPEGISISLEGYGESAPCSVLTREFGFTVQGVLERLQ